MGAWSAETGTATSGSADSCTAAERGAILDRAASALAPGGTLLVVGHDLLNLTEGWAGPTDPLVLFTPQDVIAELPGLTVERAERVQRRVTDEDGRLRVQVD